MEQNLRWRNLGKNPKYTFIRASVNNWKKKNEKGKKNDNATVHRRKGRPNLLDDEFLVKVKDVVTGARMTGEVISRKMVIAIGTEVIKSNCPSKLKDFGGHIALTEGWARGVLKSMEWSNRKDRAKQAILTRGETYIPKTHCLDY